MARNKAAVVNGNGSKTVCPVTREKFGTEGKPLLVSIGDRQIVATPREFSTGSFGWYAGEKVIVDVGGTPVRVQVGLTLTVIGSKEAD
jgi:hypothetical protein